MEKIEMASGTDIKCQSCDWKVPPGGGQQDMIEHFKSRGHPKFDVISTWTAIAYDDNTYIGANGERRSKQVV